ncbi:hypothetical protein TNCV_3272161 [Trichonephila clavipes]|nr:hypothetical protein TNCV_3272161 [Trichonephila clavipes]
MPAMIRYLDHWPTVAIQTAGVYVVLYHIHHIWHSRKRSSKSEQPIGSLCKTCKNTIPGTVPVSLGRVE